MAHNTECRANYSERRNIFTDAAALSLYNTFTTHYDTMKLFGKDLFKRSPQLPAVTYTKDNAGNHIYTLQDHDNDYMKHYRSCYTNGYADANMINIVTSIPELFAPIDIIASRVSKGVYTLRRAKTDEIVYDNKAFNRLMSQPNFRQGLEKLLYMFTFYKYACGNRYMYARVADGLTRRIDNIASLQLLKPEYTRPHLRADRPNLFYARSQQEIFDYYRVNMYGDSEDVPSEAVYYDSFLDVKYDPSNPLRGYSPLIADEGPISNLMAVYIARNVIYVKRGELGYLVSKKTDDAGTVAMTPGEKKALQDEQQRVYGFGHDKTLVAISEVPIDFIRTSLSIEELQPFDETLASALAVYSTLGVLRSFVPSKDNPTYNNGPADERKIYSDVIIPNGWEIARIFDVILGLPSEGLYCHVSYDHVEALQENKKEKADVDKVTAETAILLYKENVITKNEMLVRLGLEEIGAVGDVYINDTKNPEPLAVKLGVGGLQALKEFLMSGLPAEVLNTVLELVFGLSTADAAKITKGLPTKSANNGNEVPTPPNTGA